MRHRVLLLLLSALWLLVTSAVAADFTGRVVGVADGDTITVLHSGKGERIRLHGIDCPEKPCPIRDQAGARLTNLTTTR